MALPSGCEQLSFRLTPLSPIHVGDGSELDWTRVLLTEKTRSVLILDPTGRPPPDRLASALAALADEAVRGPVRPADFLRRVQQVLRKHERDLGALAAGRLAIAPRLFAHLSDQFGAAPAAHRDTINAIHISRTAHDARTGVPYLPGSGVKGAIRTAWLDRDTRWLRERERERDVLGGAFDQDPFSQLMVSDVAGEAIPSGVIRARNVRRLNANEARLAKGLPVSVEALLPWGRSILSGEIRIRLRRNVPMSLTIRDLMATCNAFHIRHFRAQSGMLGAHVDGWWLAAMEKLTQSLSDIPGPVALIRLGKFCTAESKTSRERKINIGFGKNGPNASAGTTFWIAGDQDDRLGGLPFGWALLEPSGADSLATPLLQQLEQAPFWKGMSEAINAASAAPQAPLPAENLTEADQIIARLDAAAAPSKPDSDTMKGHLASISRLTDPALRAQLIAWVKASDRMQEVLRKDFRLKDLASRLGLYR